MNYHEIYDLVRKIDPAGFSEEVHGPGYRVIRLEPGRCVLYNDVSLARRLLHRDAQHYFVKRLSAPLVIDTWKFRWSEGTSAVALEFTTTFSIHVVQPEQARKLVEALSSGTDTGRLLYELINEVLHARLSAMASSGSQRDLFAYFRDERVGMGESGDLNDKVSTMLSERLGESVFRIGFRLQHVPPMQIPVEGTDEFVLADSIRPRKVETKVLLQFENYSLYKRAGLENEDAIRAAIRKSISEAVRRNLFAVKYHDVVESFVNEKTSLESKMRADIAADAQRLGYGIQMFQSFPGIAALDLLRGMRIDIPAETLKYRPKDSTGYVQMELALSVKASKLKLLNRMIDPDDRQRIDQLVSQHVQQLCQDEIQKIKREEFNLHFDDKIVPALERAIEEGLARYGLAIQVIKIIQAPTDESRRFRALCNEPAAPFKALISAQADDGEADDVEVEGSIEITSLVDGAWDKFEGKDFGFRSDSNWSDERLRTEASRRKLTLSSGGTIPEASRQALAIAFELDALRERVVAILQEKLSKIPALGVRWATLQGSSEIERIIQKFVSKAIAEEHGMVVVLRGVLRRDTDSEITRQFRRKQDHRTLRTIATNKADAAIAMSETNAQIANDLQRRAHEVDVEAYTEAVRNNEEIPEHIAKRLSKVPDNGQDAAKSTIDGAESVLLPPKSALRQGRIARRGATARVTKAAVSKERGRSKG